MVTSRIGNDEMIVRLFNCFGLYQEVQFALAEKIWDKKQFNRQPGRVDVG
jgi:hypothetical protein